MKIFTSSETLQNFVADIKTNNQKTGFAPTMGALHAGHRSLYELACKETDVVIASIFVNPTQFNNKEDLKKYPRNLESDIQYLQESKLVDALYLPEILDLYPEKVESVNYDLSGLDEEMEGASRPGHFDGVATVVERLLLQTQPDFAYFGEKDYQQLAIIKKMVETKKLPVKIIGVPVYREKNGLAMSSRNQRLSEKAKESSKIIYETLLKVEDWFRVISIPEIYKRVEKIFHSKDDMVLEYIKIAEEKTLKETDFFYMDKKYRAFIVVEVEGVRLIDNIHLT